MRGADRRGDRVGVDAPVGRLEHDRPRRRAGQSDDRRVGVVGRVEERDLIAGPGSARTAEASASVAPKVTWISTVGVELDAVTAELVLGDRAAQRRHAGQRRVLVVSRRRAPRRAASITAVRAVEVGEALAEVDRAGLLGEGGHAREDRDLGRLHRRHHRVARARMGPSARPPVFSARVPVV